MDSFSAWRKAESLLVVREEEIAEEETVFDRFSLSGVCLMIGSSVLGWVSCGRV